MFFTRLASGVVLMLAAILLLVFGDIWLLSALGVLSLAGVYELLRVWGMERHPVAVPAYAGTIGYYAFIGLGVMQWQMGILLFALLAMLVLYVAQYPKLKIDKVACCFFSLVYVSVLLSYVYQVREFQGGKWLVWLILAASWGSDTCAYVTGVLVGKRHFSKLSPKKTVEGCIGGVLGAGIIGFVYSYFFPYRVMFRLSPALVFSGVCMIGALVSQIGDLAASAIKRNYEIKDYGKLIPGHGGVLDRFDSVIFVAPFMYYLLVLTAWIRV